MFEMTDEEHDSILETLVMEEGKNILSIPGVYVELSEHFNNDILDIWVSSQSREQTQEEEECLAIRRPAIPIFG